MFLSRLNKRLIVLTVLAIALLGLVAPYLGADYFETRIERALESALGRKVAIGKARYNLFTGPGFKIEEVSIEEDPRIGVEPFAFVPELDARVDFLSLFTGKLEFSSLRLVEPAVNFAQSADGVWNVQLFLDRAPARTLPPISIRGGRLHAKFGDRKAVAYLADTDAEINHSSDGRVRMSFTGDAYRSDRQSQPLCRVALRGSYRPAASGSGPGSVELDFELERTPVQDLTKLFDARDFGLKGFVESQAHLSGPLGQVSVKGQVKTSEVASRLLLPSGGSGALPYEGTIDFLNARAGLTSAGTTALPVAFRLDAENILRQPQWRAELKLQDFVAPLLIEVAHQFGFTLPADMEVAGKLAGAVAFSNDEGVKGEFVLTEPVVKFANGGVLDSGPFQFAVEGKGVDLKVHADADASATSHLELEGRYNIDDQSLLLSVIGRPGARVVDSRRRLGPLPILRALNDGTWKGALRYTAPAEGEASWRGQVDVVKARLDVPGLAEPVTLASASLALDGARLITKNVKGTAGAIEFSGDYRYEPALARQHVANLQFAPVAVSEVERILKPTLDRAPAGFLARTLRIGSAPVPDWLRERRVEASLKFQSLRAGDWSFSPVSMKLDWNGVTVRVTDIEAAAVTDGVSLSGEGKVDLRGAAPVYEASGVFFESPYRGGQLELKAKLTSQGLGVNVIGNAKVDGTFEAARIRFSPENLFEKAVGVFELGFPAGIPKTKLTNVEVSQAGESYQGQGTTLTDGKLALELSAVGGKQLRVNGTLLPVLPPQPNPVP